MEANNTNRANSEFSSAVPPTNVSPAAVPPRPPLHRTDSRTGFPAPGPRPVPSNVPPPLQQRPQFQPGGAVNNPPQYLPRPGTPAPRGPPPGLPPQQAPGQRPPALIQRPPGQPPLGLQKPQAPQSLPARPPPSNLQFGPRQPSQVGAPITPDGSRPLLTQPQNIQRNGAPSLQPLIENKVNPPQSQQLYQGSARGPDIFDPQKNKSVTLDNPNVNNENTIKAENEASSIIKNRSYSIAAAPGAPSPLKMEDDRRKSVSAIGGKIEDIGGRAPSGLGAIQEVKSEVKDHGVRGSKENIRSEDLRDFSERPDSRLSNSKMSESFIGSFPPATPKKKVDDDDDVILQNNKVASKINQDIQNKPVETISDRSPSLTRSEESPEPKQASPMLSNKTPPKQCLTPEPQGIKPVGDAKVKENKLNSKSPVPDDKPMTPVKKPTDLYTETRKTSTPRKTASAPKSRPKDGDNDSGVDESTQGNDVNGSPDSPNKKTPCKLPVKEKSSNGLSRSSSKSATTAKTPENPLPAEKKKVPMNKIQVGTAPSPNIKAVKSKIGSLDNSSYKPGGGKVKIENRKIDFQNVTPRIAAKNDAYAPSGGTKKIASTKLEWNAKSKIGSLQNSTYKPGGGDKKIETVKLDFKEKAKPKVASTVNITHKPGGGAVKSPVTNTGTKAIENQKLEFKAQSKVGSMDNVKHRPGGGDVKIFDDKDYIKNMAGHSPAPPHSGQEDYYTSLSEWEDEEYRPMSRCMSARAPRTPRQMSPRRRRDLDEERRVIRNNERNKRPASARGPSRSACSRNSSSLLNRPAFTVY